MSISTPLTKIPVFPLWVDCGDIVLTGFSIFLINFCDCIDLLENSDISNLLLLTLPEKERKMLLLIFALLLAILILLISTFWIKYSLSVISNLLSSSPAT